MGVKKVIKTRLCRILKMYNNDLTCFCLDTVCAIINLLVVGYVLCMF